MLTVTSRGGTNFMIDRARADPDISVIIVHVFSRFGRDSSTAKGEIQELRRAGVEVLSVTDPKVDEDTAAGVYMQAITFAKNEAYSKEVAFHTREGCRAKVQTRDVETGRCFKNGGQPLFGYRAERLQRGEVKRGRPLVKCIWVPDDMVVAGRPMREWARHCLVELAGNGASLEELRAFCEKTGIPGRRKQYWGSQRGTPYCSRMCSCSTAVTPCGTYTQRPSGTATRGLGDR